MQTTYTVTDLNGNVLDSGLTAVEAMDVILTADGHEYEIRHEADGEGYRLWTSTHSRTSTAYSGLRQSVVYSLAADEATAEQEIAAKVLAARWPRKPEATTDERHAAMLAELEADAASGYQVGDRVEGGEGEDYDTGTVVEVESGVLVAWDSGVRCWAPADVLRVI